MNTLNVAAIVFLAVRYVNRTDKNTEEIYKFKYNYLDRFQHVNTEIGNFKDEVKSVTGEIKEDIATLLERTKNQ